jgi:glycerol uptake facilitator-like aquaporin
MSGQFAGALIAGAMPFTLMKLKYSGKSTSNDVQAQEIKSIVDADLNSAYGMPTEKTSIITTIIGEFIAALIFIGAVIGAIYSESSITPIFVGLALIIVLFTIGLRFALVINPAAFLMPMLFFLISKRPDSIKNAITNITFGILTNLAVAAAIGGIIYGACSI